LAKLKAKLDKGFASIDASNLGSDLFDEGDFKKVLGFITQINNGLQEMRVAGSSASAATLGLDVSAIEDARKALADLTAEYNKYKKQTVGSHNPT
jgi:hypothetical protein